MNQNIDLHYFPCVNTFFSLVEQLPLRVRTDLPFVKSGFTNRMIVLGSTGPLLLSIPIKGGRGVKCRLDEVQIDYRQNWQRSHYRTLLSCYGKSPFFYQFKDELEELYSTRRLYLIDWNTMCFDWILDKFGFNASENMQAAIKKIIYLKRGRNLKYNQVFEEKIGFFSNVSILDLLFCNGPR